MAEDSNPTFQARPPEADLTLRLEPDPTRHTQARTRAPRLGPWGRVPAHTPPLHSAPGHPASHRQQHSIRQDSTTSRIVELASQHLDTCPAGRFTSPPPLYQYVIWVFHAVRASPPVPLSRASQPTKRKPRHFHPISAHPASTPPRFPLPASLNQASPWCARLSWGVVCLLREGICWYLNCCLLIFPLFIVCLFFASWLVVVVVYIYNRGCLVCLSLLSLLRRYPAASRPARL